MAQILVVDDSGTIRTLLKKVLEDAGHSITEAVDGSDALTKLSQMNPIADIIISDVNMPNIDGITFSKKVKEHDTFKKIPIMILTTESGGDMKTLGKEIGITAWMVKPPQPPKLVEAVTKILSLKAK